MKNKAIYILGLLAIVSFGSCKKNYTCTCTTIIGGASGTQTHNIDNANYPDAKRTCNTYESQANETYPGSTACHL